MVEQAFTKESRLSIKSTVLQEKGRAIKTVDGFEIMSERGVDEESQSETISLRADYKKFRAPSSEIN